MTKKIVIIGGGTGTFVVTNIIKDHPFELTKIVTVFDSGGSSARLRDEFGFLPVGDLRQSLTALASDSGHAWIKQVLLYRFDRGEGLQGHNLGNLILTALQDLTGSTPKALEVAAKIFRLTGKIYPVTTQSSELITTFEDGSVASGEHQLDEHENAFKKIIKIELSNSSELYFKAKNAILEADYIIFGPGDMYASILPNLLVTGAKEALQASKAKLIYIVNLMTRSTQTHGFTGMDHINEMEKYAGRHMDFVLVNSGEINPDIEKKYAEFGEFRVADDISDSKDRTIIRSDFASSIAVEKQKGDVVPRTLMRHDKKKLEQELIKIIS